MTSDPITYITVSRTRQNGALYSFAKKLGESLEDGIVYRRGVKSMSQVISDARRKGHARIILIRKDRKKGVFVVTDMRNKKQVYRCKPNM